MKRRAEFSINDMAQGIHQIAREHGWWDEGQKGKSFGEFVALCHSELSEALEEYRSGREPGEIYTKCYSDHCDDVNSAESGCKFCRHNKPEGIPIELADCIIRILDYCAGHNIDIGNAIHYKSLYNQGRPHRHGDKVI